MMHTEMIADTNVVTATIDGPLQSKEIEEFREQVQALARSGSRPRLLFAFEDVDVSEAPPAAIWEDLKSAKVLDEADRIAVLADEGWMTKVGDAADALAPAKIETFSLAQRDRAVAWLIG